MTNPRERIEKLATQYEADAVELDRHGRLYVAIEHRLTAQAIRALLAGEGEPCEGCPPVGYPTDKTRCWSCSRRAPPPSGKVVEACERASAYLAKAERLGVERSIIGREGPGLSMADLSTILAALSEQGLGSEFGQSGGGADR